MPSIDPVAGVTGYSLVYDLIQWLIQNCLRTDNSANFSDGENFVATATPPAEHVIVLYNEFQEDQPDDAGVVKEVDEGDSDRGLIPIRIAKVGIQLRLADIAGVASSRDRAMAATKALEQFFKTVQLKLLTHVILPSGRRVLAFRNPTYRPLGYDASGRFQVILEVGVEFNDVPIQ